MSNQDILKDYKGSSFIEKLSYGIGDAAGAMLLGIPGSYLTVYCTDSLAMGAAFLGTMMVICRLLDGISDVIVGMIIERTNTKLGKARPWFVFSIVPLILSFVALFHVPRGISQTGQVVYIYAMYILMTVVFYTMNNLGYHAMLPRFSLTPQDRASVSAVRSFMCCIFMMAINVIIPIIIPVLGGEAPQHTWTVIVAAVGLIGLICYSVTGFAIKEKLSCEPVTADQKAELSARNRKALKFLVKDKYFYILIIASTVWFTSMNMMGIFYYFARDIIGNGALTGMLVMAGNAPSLFAMPVIPALFKKFGQRKVIIVGLIVGTLASAAIMFSPRNLVFVMVCLFARGIATAPQMAGVATMASDLTEYTEKKLGLRTEGLATSAYSVGVKLGTGLGGAFVAWGLAIGGYNYMLEVQSEATQNAVIFVLSILPALCYAIGAVFMKFWNVNKETV